jgi:HlyD family secretion protein
MDSKITIPKRRRRRWPWLLLALLILSGAGFAVYSANGQGNDEQTIKIEDIDLRVGKSEVSDIQVTVSEVGTIEPAVKVDVKSNLSGKVTELLVREGDRVSRGQIMAKVEPDVNQAQTLSDVRSQLNHAEIRSDEAQRHLETNTRLHEEGYVSEQALKDFKVQVDSALEDLDSARTKMRIVEESGIPLGGPISTTQRVNLLSPMEGFVIKRNVEVGQTVTSGVSSFNEGTVIYTVADLRSMLIKASVNEVDIGRVRHQMPVVITVDAFPYKRFDGTVTHISPAARLKEKIRVFDIEVTLQEQIPDFRAGMTANIEVRGDKVEKALGVPVEAIFKKDDKEVVYVMKKPFETIPKGDKQPRKLGSGKLDISDAWQKFFEERPVTVGIASLERAQVLTGLEEGVELALEDPTRPRQIEEED